MNGTLISDGGTFPVSYDDCRLSKIHGEIIEKVLPLTSLPHDRNLSRAALRVFWAQLLTKCAVHLLHASVYFKHKAYINEDEYRFLEMYRADVAPVVKFRARNYQRIKYLEFDWKSAGPDVLKEIIIGPAADFEKSKRFAKDCLREAGIDPANVTVTQSQIPYKPT